MAVSNNRAIHVMNDETFNEMPKFERPKFDKVWSPNRIEYLAKEAKWQRVCAMHK